MDFGLSTADLGEIIKVLHSFPEVKQAILFGSRAKGTYKRGSDVDIALQGKDITLETVAAFRFS